LLQENAKPACGRQGAKKNLLAAWRLCKKKKIAHERQKKNSARRIKKRYGAPHCCGPGSKGAETQRNEEWPHKDAKPACGRQGAKKKLFAAWRLCEKKKSFLEDPNINP